MSRPTYHNHLPPLPADCILPKFQVPKLSIEFNEKAEIHRRIPHNFLTGSLLGIPVEFGDLSVYTKKVDGDLGVTKEDMRYVPELAEGTTDLIIPSKPNLTVVRPPEAVVKPTENKDAELRYRKSPHFDSLEDDEIQEQLKCAFNGNVPKGHVSLVRKAPDLSAVMVKGAGTLDPKMTLLLSMNKKYLKGVYEPGDDDDVSDVNDDEPIIPTRGYHVSGEKTATVRSYMYADEDGSYNMGEVKVKYTLRGMPPKEARKTITATPVIIRRGDERRSVNFDGSSDSTED